jgi:hypothetical protein
MYLFKNVSGSVGKEPVFFLTKGKASLSQRKDGPFIKDSDMTQTPI